MTRKVTSYSKLIGSDAVQGDGSTLGRVDDVEINTSTGQVKQVLVVASPEQRSSFRKDGKGRLRIPGDKVKAVQDNVIVQS